MRYSGFIISVLAIVILVTAGTTVFAQTSDQDTKAFIERTTVSLREAGKPLSMEQIQKMESLEAGQNFRNEVMNILTNEQKDALRKSYQENTRRRRGSRGGDQGGSFVERMSGTLEEAKLPLSDEQKKQLEGLEFGPGMREKMAEILTEDQSKALQEARQRGGQDGGRSTSGFIGGALEKAGDPLTDEQKEKLDALERGPEMREQISKILTDSQNKILEKQRGQRGGGGGGGGGR